MSDASIDVAILGAGNGGLAAAADLSARGFKVSLANRTRERLEPLLRDGLRMVGVLGEQTVRLERLTTRVEQAVEGARVVMLTLPATGHAYYAEALAGCLEPGQLVLLNPGSTCGAIHVARILQARGLRDVTVGEFNTLTYIARMAGPSTVNITGTARRLWFGCLPASRKEAAFGRVQQLYPAAQLAPTVLETSLTNLNAVLHPPGMILNAGWIEHTAGQFYYYYEGTTPAVARVIEQLDHDRLQVARAYGVQTPSFLQFFYEAGYTSARAYRAGSVFEALKDSVPNRYIKSQPNLEGRYIHEDVGYGLVPMQALARLAGVATPTLDALVHLASVATGMDWESEGLNARRLGLVDLADAGSLLRWLRDG